MRKISAPEAQAMTREDLLHALESGEGGLTSAQAAERLRQVGYNEIAETRRNPVLGFLKRYWGPMPWLLELSIVLTGVLRHYTESVIIFVLLTINAVIGAWQSGNSRRAVELLKQKLEIRTKVLRDGAWTQADARELAPGDVVTLRLGDLVAADVYVLDGQVSVDQSALTGESLPRDVSAGDVLYSGSVIRRGEARCAVIATGEDTTFGKTVELVKIAKPKSKQEELMLSIVKSMLLLGIAASAVVSAYAVYLHKDFLFILSFIVIFLIGAVPVALPAVLTIVQAAGAMELSRKGVLVTKLDSVEDAASIDIFCFDKTGTITRNQLSVVDCVPFGEFERKEVLRLAAQASEGGSMDPIDRAVLASADAEGISSEGETRLRFIPFSPETKRTEAVFPAGDGERHIIKGAVPTVLGLCGTENPSEAKAAEETENRFSRKGFRTLGVAVSDGGTFRLAGLLAIADPPREDSAQMIARLRELGIRSLMITGDGAAIARQVAGQVGIGDRILPASALQDLSHDQQLELIRENDGFAEVLPEDKYRIVKLLQESGHMVGMTGDGVNDSPALKQAELGTAVCGAADVARASASIVLTRPGLGEIIDAVVTSRKTYQRMLTWVINKITKVVEVVFLFSIGFFWLHDTVISLLGMSLLVFANDFVTMSIATDHVRSTDSPNQWNMRSLTASSLVLGLLFALEDLLVIWIGLRLFHLSFEQLQTLVLLALMFNTQVRMLMVRERRHFWSSAPSRYLLGVNLATIAAFALLGVSGVLLPALTGVQVLTLLGIVAVLIPVIDSAKFYLFRRFPV